MDKYLPPHIQTTEGVCLKEIQRRVLLLSFILNLSQDCAHPMSSSSALRSLGTVIQVPNFLISGQRPKYIYSASCAPIRAPSVEKCATTTVKKIHDSPYQREEMMVTFLTGFYLQSRA